MNPAATVRYSRVGDIVGSQNVITDPKDLHVYAVDGLEPQVAVRPATAQEVAELVKFAAAEKLAIIPTGARTKLGIGIPPARYDLAVDMTRLDGVISYDPGDLTLSVEPGIPLARLSEVLSEHKQFLPLAVSFFDRTTVGGTLASGVDSSLRQAYGTARDFVLGMEFVSGEGALTKSGGRVVKNVSGYDLHKLMLGAIGSLGIITRINFKTFPLPQTSASFVAAFPDAAAAGSFNALIQKSPLRCQSVEILSPKASQILNASQASPILPAANSDWPVAVSIAANEAVVARAHRDLEAMARSIADDSLRGFTRLEAAAEKTLWRSIREFPVIARSTHDAAIIKLSVLPSNFPALCGAISTIAGKHSFEIAYAFRGVGVGYCVLFARNSDAAQFNRCCEELLSGAAKSAALASIPWCSLELKRQLNIWGQPREDFLLMQRVKRAFDPHNIFAPGRFVGGL